MPSALVALMQQSSRNRNARIPYQRTTYLNTHTHTHTHTHIHTDTHTDTDTHTPIHTHTGIRYHIYRVYGAGLSGKTRIEIIHDLGDALRDQRIRLCLAI